MIRIAIIGQNKILRQSLKTLLEQVSCFTIPVECNFQEFNSFTSIVNIDVVLLDTTIGEVYCPEIGSRVKAFSKNIRLLVLSDASELYFWKLHQRDLIDGILPVNSSKKKFENIILEVMKIDPDTKESFFPTNEKEYNQIRKLI